jgi:hypothetical protein
MIRHVLRAVMERGLDPNKAHTKEAFASGTTTIEKEVVVTTEKVIAPQHVKVEEVVTTTTEVLAPVVEQETTEVVAVAETPAEEVKAEVETEEIKSEDKVEPTEAPKPKFGKKASAKPAA